MHKGNIEQYGMAISRDNARQPVAVSISRRIGRKRALVSFGVADINGIRLPSSILSGLS